jgi:hypothetical protein
MKNAGQITLTDDGRKTLQRWARGRRTPSRLVLRAGIVLRAADGTMNKDIVKALGTSPTMVQRVWKANGLQPHRSKTFKLSNRSIPVVAAQ